MLFYLYFSTFFSILAFTNADIEDAERKALEYLSQFGYLDWDVRNANETVLSSLVSENKTIDAVKEFQNDYNLQVTGTLDADTMKSMVPMRCQVSQLPEPSYMGSTKGKWRKTHLTYRVTKYTRTLDKATVDKTAEQAFGMWAAVTPLTFSREEEEPVDIEIRFETEYHGCKESFDGPGYLLAHAYHPSYHKKIPSSLSGDAHFDDAEKWTINTKKGVNLLQLMTHEFGHSLGLGHSKLVSAVMYDEYLGYHKHFRLAQDDINGIQSLYGKRPEAGEEVWEEAPIHSKPSGKTPQEDYPLDSQTIERFNLCDNTSIDTVFKTYEGETFAFKGDYYWEMPWIEGLSDGLISRRWPGMPTAVDAAFTGVDGREYFFKGDLYWMFDGRQLSQGFPRRISSDFAGVPGNLDAALAVEEEVYFFKGSMYWKHPRDNNQLYPRPIHESWPGVPSNLDAAVSFTDGVYFFKDTSYHRFNLRLRKVDSGGLPTAKRWFGCSSKNT